MTAGWIAQQEQNIAQSLIYRGTDPDINAPEFYGIFYADGRKKRVASAFSLWSDVVKRGNRLTVTNSATSGTVLAALAAQSASGEVGLLVANPNSQAYTYQIALPSGAAFSTGTLKEINSSNESINTSTVSNATVSIPAYGVQLLSFLATGTPVAVTEFYHSGLNHYFRTANAAEAAAIDQGSAGAGWARTGQSDPAWLTASVAPSAAVPVCRFYGTPGRGPNSHFYTADAAECAAVKLDSGWTYEGIAFYALPVSGGACSTGYRPLYRSYNNRSAQNDSNHRFTTDLVIRSQMTQLNWIDEGAVMCMRLP